MFDDKKSNIFRQFLKEGILFLLSLVYLVPLWMVFINSFKSSKDAFKLGLGLPQQWLFENYAIVWKEANVLKAIFNGVFIATVAIFISMIVTSMAAFIITRRQSKVTSAAYKFFIAGIIIPPSIVPVYLLFRFLHLTNTYTGLIVLFISATIPMGILLYSGFIKTVPRELDEAAIIDGCSFSSMFFKIIFPLLKPISSTIIVLNFIGIWNDVQNQLFFTQSDKWMLPLSVYKFFGLYTYDWNLVFADIIIVLIPLLTIFLTMQKFIISGLTGGSVKG